METVLAEASDVSEAIAGAKIQSLSMTEDVGLSEKQVQGLETGLFDMNIANPRFFSHIRKRK